MSSPTASSCSAQRLSWNPTTARPPPLSAGLCAVMETAAMSPGSSVRIGADADRFVEVCWSLRLYSFLLLSNAHQFILLNPL
jgi:hypothetical protein